MSLEINALFDEIWNELDRAEEKWPDFPSNDVVHAISILSEESGECVREANRLKLGNVNYGRLRSELIQTGAMVLRCLKNLDKEFIDG